LAKPNEGLSGFAIVDTNSMGSNHGISLLPTIAKSHSRLDAKGKGPIVFLRVWVHIRTHLKSINMQGVYWIGTLYEYSPPTVLPSGVTWLKGQSETCPTTGRIHVQCIAGFPRSTRLAAVKRLIAPGHWELTRSSAAESYVWKDDTAVPGTRFELGARPVRRNSSRDWDRIKELAVSGLLSEIPSDIYVRYYSGLCRIASDHSTPLALVRECFVFWGPTGTGKSRRAWAEAGSDAYAKDPRTKWWCGYRGQGHVIVDEFRGAIDISHMLRWLDRYPVSVETKGSSRPLAAEKIWITSNLNPEYWYPDIDSETKSALLRRLNITNFS